MADFEKIELLMLEVLGKISDEFGNSAVLKGGMELRFLDCPRYTNGLDYVFIPFTSKKKIKDRLLKCLSGIDGVEISHSMDSKCIRCYIQRDKTGIQVEVTVARQCKTEELSTSAMARGTRTGPRIISVMKLDTAFSHKLAAWFERRLFKDLYDIYFFSLVIGIKPDFPVLLSRLESMRVRDKGRFRRKTVSVEDFIAVLETEKKRITHDVVESSMKDFLAPEELPGLEYKIKSAISRVISTLTDYNAGNFNPK
ncbi:MAG: nucleotidyl transferase AbiEii/AbiGii toxin family protein [Fibrobacterota bacterium]